MSETAQQIEKFRNFGKVHLENHTTELSTGYQNRELASSDLRQEAYKEHTLSFQKELEDKIEELLTEDNEYLRPALNGIKERFIEKLRQSFPMQ